jgi:hypothetical protein
MTTPHQPTGPAPAAEDAPRNRGEAVGLYERNIEYDRITGDYAMSLRLDGGPWELIGYASTPLDCERVLDDLVYERLTHDARLQPVA